MPAILTVRTEDDGVESYGSHCPEHPDRDRSGLVQRHAVNVVAKHNREDHAEPVLNLSAAARAVEHASHGPGATEARVVWLSLVGLDARPARDYLAAVLAEPQDVLVHVAPF